jgi:hypothetical protein
MDKQQLITKFRENIDLIVPKLTVNMTLKPNESHVYSSTNLGTGITIRLVNQSEFELFENINKILLDTEKLSNAFSEKFLRNETNTLLQSILKDQSLKENLIIQFIDKLWNQNLDDFFVLSEVENIQILDDQDYDFIDSIIKKLKKEDLPKIVSQTETWYALYQELLNKPVIITRVKAGEPAKAEEKARQNFLISLNLLRLYAPSTKPSLRGGLLQNWQTIRTINETKEEMQQNSSHVGDRPGVNVVTLNQRNHLQVKELGLDQLKVNCPISNVVKTCLYWYGLGLDEAHHSPKLLNFVTVLEGALKKKDETTELTKIVSERGAILLEATFEQKIEIRNELKRIYGVRSKVVHTASLGGDMDLASRSGGYARSVLLRIISLSKKYGGNFDKFIEDIDNAKLKGTLT